MIEAVALQDACFTEFKIQRNPNPSQITEQMKIMKNECSRRDSNPGNELGRLRS